MMRGLKPLAAACTAAAILCGTNVYAQDQGVQELDAEPTRLNKTQPVVVPDPTPTLAVTPTEKFTFGGAIRARYDWRFNDVSLAGAPKASEHFDFDTLALKAAYDSDTIFGAAQYRFYGTYGPWGFKAIYIRQDIVAKNPIRNDLITVGGFDFAYNMATHGNFVSAEVTYKIADPIGPFLAAPYFGYSAYDKDNANFKATERFILGSAWTLTADPNLVIYTEGVFGRNDPYVGAGQFVNGLAQGGDNRWKSRFIMNIGYYF